MARIRLRSVLQLLRNTAGEESERNIDTLHSLQHNLDTFAKCSHKILRIIHDAEFGGALSLGVYIMVVSDALQGMRRTILVQRSKCDWK